MCRVVLDQQALLGGTAKRCAVRARRPEIGVPGVQVGVEMHQRHRPVHLVDRLQRRQRDGVVTAEQDDALLRAPSRSATPSRI